MVAGGPADRPEARGLVSTRDRQPVRPGGNLGNVQFLEVASEVPVQRGFAFKLLET